MAEGAACLTTDWVLGGFSKTKNVVQQRDQDFVLQCKLESEQSLKHIPKKQMQAPIETLDFFANLGNTRNEYMALAYLSGHYTI